MTKRIPTVRFEYPKKFFRNAGKAFFNNRDIHKQNIDDSVSNEEKQQLLKENHEQQLNSNIIENLIELATKISVELNNLRAVLEKAIENPNSKEWVESSLAILATAVNLAHTYGFKELEKILINTARILLSADRVGKAGLILEKFYRLYTTLCIISAELLLGKTQEKIFDAANLTYNSIASELEKMGIKLISDDEELIGQINEEIPQVKEISPPAESHESIPLGTETPLKASLLSDVPEIPLATSDNYQVPNSNISTTEDSSSPPLTQETQQLEKEETGDEIIKQTELTPNKANLDLPSEISNSLPTYSENSQTLITTPSTPFETQNIDFSSTSTLSFCDNSNYINDHLYKLKPSNSEDLSSLLNLLSTIKNKKLKDKIEATLKALAENTPDIAKQKALELAIEIAKMEIEEIQKQQKATELQIDSLKGEIEQVDINIHESKYEAEQITKELQSQEKQKENILKEKQNSESELLKTKQELQNIEEQISLLLKQKEETITKIQNIEETLKCLNKNLEENQQNILSIKETLSHTDNKISTLNDKKLCLLSALKEKENHLNNLAMEISRKEDTLIKLKNGLDLIKLLNENVNEKAKEDPIPPDINNDLFSGGEK